MAAAPTPSTSSASALRCERFDLSGRLGRFERTPSGGLRIPAYISRTGVQTYRDGEGREVREYRPAGEVLAEASYRSFDGAPVTREHPPELVTPATWKDHAIGSVRNVRPDGDRVSAEIVIEDAATIAAIEAGELVEVSAGYTAELDASPGVYDGQPFDVVQRTIRGNHVGLGPEGWGRAGPSVRLRIDAAREIIPATPTVGPGPTSQRTDQNMSDQNTATREREIGRLTTERDAAVSRADAAEARVAELEAEATVIRTRLDAATSQDEIDGHVSRRLGLLDQARTILGSSYKWAGKSDAQIMRDAVRKAGHKIGDDASADRVAGAFETVLALSKSSKGSKSTDAAEEESEETEEEETEDARGDGGSFTVTTVKRGDGAPPKRAIPSVADKWRRAD